MCSINQHNENSQNSCQKTFPIKIFEFFSGIGGLRLSFDFAIKKLCEVYKFDEIPEVSVSAFDVSACANSVYSLNFKDFPSAKCIEHLTLKDVDGKAVIWLMSPPCQPYTRRGKCLDTEDKRSHALSALLNLLSEMKSLPSLIFVENVVGFEKSASHRMMSKILLERRYSINRYFLSPSQFGIPNTRVRFYLVAIHLLNANSLKSVFFQRNSLTRFTVENSKNIMFEINKFLKEKFEIANKKQNKENVISFLFRSSNKIDFCSNFLSLQKFVSSFSLSLHCLPNKIFNSNNLSQCSFSCPYISIYSFFCFLSPSSALSFYENKKSFESLQQNNVNEVSSKNLFFIRHSLQNEILEEFFGSSIFMKRKVGDFLEILSKDEMQEYMIEESRLRKIKYLLLDVADNSCVASGTFTKSYSQNLHSGGPILKIQRVEEERNPRKTDLSLAGFVLHNLFVNCKVCNLTVEDNSDNNAFIHVADEQTKSEDKLDDNKGRSSTKNSACNNSNFDSAIEIESSSTAAGGSPLPRSADHVESPFYLRKKTSDIAAARAENLITNQESKELIGKERRSFAAEELFRNSKIHNCAVENHIHLTRTLQPNRQMLTFHFFHFLVFYS